MQNWAKRSLFLVLVIYAGVIVFTFRDYGITPDEGHHVAYGESVVLWYTSGFEERRIFTWADVWLYGGFYDTIVHLVTRLSPLELYDTRHLSNAIVGLLGIVVAYRLGALLGSPWVGLLAAVFLVLTPRYYGHAFNNNKDIPFAVLYLWSLYWQVKVLGVLPRVPWRWVMMTGLVTGLAMGIRVGGVLLIGYAGLFWGLWFVLQWRNRNMDLGACINGYISRIGLMFGIAYGVMLVFWPWAQTDPLRHPFQALTVFSKFPGRHLNFFEGAYFRSQEIPWYYAPKWLLLTLPEFFLLGLVLFGLWVILYRKGKGWDLKIGLLIFACLFPLFYLIGAGTPLYNATRHFMFVVPPLAILASWGVYIVGDVFRERWRLGFVVFVGVLLCITLVDMIRLHPFQTVYFNRIFAGGLQKAASFYDTDNYSNGYKQGVLWLHDHAEKSENARIKVGGGNALDHLLDLERFEIEGIDWRADYYLATTNMRLHTNIPGEVVHTVERMGVPLLYVIRPDTTKKSDPMFAEQPYPFRDIKWGQLYQAEGQWDAALEMFQKSLSIEGSEIEVYQLMGEVYEAQDNPRLAIAYYQKALDAGANVVTVGTQLGNVFQSVNEFDQAIDLYKQALELRPNYLGALMNLGRALFALNRNEEAIAPLEKVVSLFPDQSIHLQRLGLVYYRNGRDNDAIVTFERAIELDPKSMLAWYHLGLAQEKKGRSDLAEKVYLNALEQEAHREDILLRLATIYYEANRLETAVRVLADLLEHHSTSWQGFYLLGQVYEKIGDQQVAIAAYQKVLSLNPDHDYAQMRLTQLKQ